jgi:hypothetical protein
MHPFELALLGLVLDIIGAFLLSVEAIKLDNFSSSKDASIFRSST